MAFQTSGFDKGLTDVANDVDKRIRKGVDKMLNGPSTPPAIKFNKGFLYNRTKPSDKLVFQFNPESMQDKRGVEYSTTQPVQSELPIYQHIAAGERIVSFKLFFNGMEPSDGNSPTRGIKQPFDNKFGILSRPLQKGIDGAINFGMAQIPYPEVFGTAGGIVFNKIFTSDPQPLKTLDGQSFDVLNAIKTLDNWLHGDGYNPPAVLLFSWPGYNDSAWILTEMSLETTMWDVKQNPLHVTADITLKEVDRKNFKTRFSKTNNVFVG